MINTTSSKYIITLDKLYYKAHLPQEEYEKGKWRFTGPLGGIHGENPIHHIKVGKNILLESNFNKAESKKHEFTYKYDIYYIGNKIGMLHYGPDYNSFLKDSGIVGIQINNYSLYQNYCFDALRELHACADLRFKHFTELDLAVDTNENLISRFDNYYGSPEIYLSKKLNVSVQKQSYPLTRCSHFTLYEKTLELKSENTSKPYIKRYFLANGFGWNERIFRCELRLNRKVLTSEYEPDLLKMSDPEYLFSIYNHFQKRFMCFKKIVGKNSTRYPLNLLVDYQVDNDFIRVEKEQGESLNTVSRHSLKQALKQFFWLIENGTDENIKSKMQNLILGADLSEWVAKKKPYFERFDDPNQQIQKGLFTGVGDYDVEQ